MFEWKRQSIWSEMLKCSQPFAEWSPEMKDCLNETKENGRNVSLSSAKVVSLYFGYTLYKELI